jgi:hypothetical protein
MKTIFVIAGFMNTYGRRPANSILIISYETFRLHAHMLHTSEVKYLKFIRYRYPYVFSRDAPDIRPDNPAFFLYPAG